MLQKAGQGGIASGSPALAGPGQDRIRDRKDCILKMATIPEFEAIQMFRPTKKNPSVFRAIENAVQTTTGSFKGDYWSLKRQPGAKVNELNGVW